jgi:hypothetical protein
MIRMLRMCRPLAVKSSYTLAALFLSAVQSFGQVTDKQSQASSRQPAINELLSWLPEDTESVIAANGPFEFPDLDRPSRDISGKPELEPADLQARLQVLPLSLFGLDDGGLQQALKGKRVVLALEGSRHFRPPAALGEVQYEGCGIAVFGPGVILDADAFMRNAANSAVRFENIAGLRIAVFEKKLENDVWTTFVGFPRTNIVLAATNVEYLRVVLTRINHPSTPRALPESLPEWKYVNTRALAWGVRHYQKLEAKLDPTSPFSGQHAAAVPDDSAIGVGFWFDSVARRTANVMYMSANKTSSQILQDYLGVADARSASTREFQIHFRQPTPNVVEGSVALSIEEGLDRFLLGVLSMLGHAIYI